MSFRERKRYITLILAEAWDALNGDAAAANTIYHAAYHLKNECGDAAIRKGLLAKNIANLMVPLPARYDVADLATDLPTGAQPLDPWAPEPVQPPHAREAEVLRDALRYLTR